MGDNCAPVNEGVLLPLRNLMSHESKRLFLIDGSALVYRAYFAFIRNPLITRKGEHTSAVFGFVSSLLKLMREESPTHLAVVWDTPKPTFRHEMYPEYKATRSKMPDDMVPQLGRLREVLDLMGVPMLEMEGFEADDVIGTIALQSSEMNCPTVLVTGDKDYMQLVDEHVLMLNPKRSGEDNEWLDIEGVEKKFGVPPDKVIEVLALMGDSSDNIPGVAGIGPKTAVKLIKDHGTVEKLLESIDKVEAKGVREKLERDREVALLSHKLVTIDRHVPITWDLDSFKIKSMDANRLEPLFVELEFGRLLEDIRRQSGSETAPELDLETKGEYRTVTSDADLKDVVKKIRKAGMVAVDTETTGINPHTASLVGICLSWEEKAGVYIPVAHSAEGAPNADLDLVRKHLDPLLSDAKIKWIAHHAKYDSLILERAQFKLAPFAFDTMLASYILDPSTRHGLDAVVLELCGHHMIPISSIIGKGKKQISFAEVPVKQATEYAAEDADFTLRIYHILEERIREAKLEKLLYEVEQPLVPVLANMEAAGVTLDVDLLAKLSSSMADSLVDITHDIETLAGHGFNIASTKQLQQVLFEELGLPTKGKTTKGTGYSTNQSVLEELAKLHDLPKKVLEYRELSKLKSTYIDALPLLVDENSRVHTSFNQTIAATGRLSSADPNLQNIPIRTETGRQIRKAFIPRGSDFCILAADYSQIELRILAEISGDKTLRSAFANDEDVHRRTAAAVYDVDTNDVTPEMRAVAKTANFAIIYGVSAFGLSQQTDLSVPEARKFIDTYFERYPQVKSYMDESIQRARDVGFVTTLLGRRRFLPEIMSDHRQRREFAERMAINTPIQGSAADLIKVAMINIHAKMSGMRSLMILQVHDELVFDAHKDELAELQALVRQEMEHAFQLDVPIKVDMGTGNNWLDAK